MASPTALRYAMDMDVPLLLGAEITDNFSMDNLLGAGSIGSLPPEDCNDAQKLGDIFPVKTGQEDEFRFRQRCSHADVAHTAEHSMEAKATTKTGMEAALGCNFYTGERSNGAWKTIIAGWYTAVRSIFLRRITDDRFANGGNTRDREWVVQFCPRWLLDSGASYHSTGDRTIFRSLHSCELIEERSARTLLLAAATLLATFIYTGISRPGGFWEERTTHSYKSGRHRAAEDNSNQAPKNAPLQTGWHVASAVANHLTGNQSILTNFISFPGGRAVNVPNQGRMKALGSGSVKTHNVVLQNVWYVPGLEMNLVSAGQLTKLGHKVCFGPYGCRISKGSDDNVIGKARFTDDFQFEVEFVKVPPPN